MKRSRVENNTNTSTIQYTCAFRPAQYNVTHCLHLHIIFELINADD